MVWCLHWVSVLWSLRITASRPLMFFYTIHERHMKNTCTLKKWAQYACLKLQLKVGMEANMWQKAPLEPFSTLTSQQIVKYCLFPPPFLFLANHVWRLMCRHCARSCKINSCIFKRDANESAWWTGLLAWNLIRSVVPFANEFTFPLCLSLSLFFFTLFHFPCPLQPIMRVHVMNSKSLVWQLKKKKKKKSPAIPNTHLIFYTTKWLLFAEKKETEKEEEEYTEILAACFFWFSCLCF